MKKTMRVFILSLASILCFCSFLGCTKKTSPIPDGLYVWQGDNNIYESIYKLTENDIRSSFGWEIKGDTAQRWTSGSVDYKAKIVEKDGEIYFEGYMFRDIFDVLFRGGKQSGDTKIYRVIYDETEKSITLIYK